MIKLWERCEIAKIAVKRGVQNTNSIMMAEELKVGKLWVIYSQSEVNSFFFFFFFIYMPDWFVVSYHFLHSLV